MKQDIKNVIITFGLIATAIVSGSFLYRKKMDSEYVLAVKQEQLQNIIDEQQAILDQLKQPPEPNTASAVPSVPVETVTRSTQTAKAAPKATTTAQSVPVKPQPTATAVSATPPKASTTTSPAPKPKVVTSPARKSKAS